MKIYKSKSGGFWFAQSKENGWFCFSSTPPDIGTLNLCSGMFGYDEEKTAWNDAIEIPKEIETKVFNRIARQRNNYQDICNFILRYYPETSQKELDDKFDHHPILIKLTKDIINKSKSKDYINTWGDYMFGEIYDDVKSHMHTWNNDVERVTKYVLEHDIDRHLSIDHNLVDVWGDMHPTKRFLLHEFYRSWGDKLDKLIDKAIEMYPDNKDFDKAYYYVKDKL